MRASADRTQLVMTAVWRIVEVEGKVFIHHGFGPENIVFGPIPDKPTAIAVVREQKTTLDAAMARMREVMTTAWGGHPLERAKQEAEHGHDES